MTNDSHCEVTGKRKYLSEREALETAAHQLSLPNAPKQLKTYLCTLVRNLAPHQKREQE